MTPTEEQENNEVEVPVTEEQASAETIKVSLTGLDVLNMFNVLDYVIEGSKDAIPVDYMATIGAFHTRMKSIKEDIEAERPIDMTLEDIATFEAVVSSLVSLKAVFNLKDYSFVGSIYDKVLEVLKSAEQE